MVAGPESINCDFSVSEILYYVVAFLKILRLSGIKFRDDSSQCSHLFLFLFYRCVMIFRIDDTWQIKFYK